MKNQWIIERSGSTIRLVNSWFGGSKLYINGDLKDFEKSMVVSPKRAFLSGSLTNPEGVREVIEVYAKSGLFAIQFRITSNGEEIFCAKQ